MTLLLAGCRAEELTDTTCSSPVRILVKLQSLDFFCLLSSDFDNVLAETETARLGK